ncbi:MAG: PqqD family protein, partial [Acidobacteriota bacterium]
MNKLKTRNENIVVQDFANEILIYDLKTNKAYCLNETSAIIWQMCDGNRTITEIADLMSVKLKTLVSEELVWLTVYELKREDLLENDSETERFLNSVSRRELIRKAGLASMIALPLVNSIIAPSAAQAASAGSVALLNACTTTQECQSGLTCATCTGGTCNSPQVCCTGSGTIGTNGVIPALLGIGFLAHNP